jgi:phosphate starvation-inducible PhoH-like protein
MAAKNRCKAGISLEVELTRKQELIAKELAKKETKITFLSGCAGTGKTWLAFYVALYLLNKGEFEKILYLRTPIETGRSLGALKGELNDKIKPYLEVCKDKLHEFMLPEKARQLIRQEKIEGDVINFIRGKTLKNTIVIFDEASNANLHEIETVLTRIQDCKVILCGDSRQSDIKQSCFDNVCEVFKDPESKSQGVRVFEFDKSDIMRDPIIGFLLDRLDGLHM